MPETYFITDLIRLKKMGKYNFIPRNESELRAWAENFRTQLPNHTAALGATPDDERRALDIANNIANAIDDVQRKEVELKAATAHYKNLVETRLPELRAIVGSWKTLPNYTESIGQSLRVIGTAPAAPDWNNLKPAPKIQTLANGVRITYVRGQTHGVNVYCRRGGEPNFTYLGRDSSSPFDDERPNLQNAPSERREYYLVFVKNDKEIGQRSDVVAVNV